MPQGERANSLMPAIKELERIFIALRPLFKIEMPLPTITIQSSGKKNWWGWHWAARWQNDRKEAISEINICAEELRRGGIAIVSTLVHEMVHYACDLAKIEDCKNNYHNKKFKARAESVGMVVERQQNGWAKTTLGPDLLKRVEKLKIDESAFHLRRIPVPKTGGQKCRMLKWACDCTIVRCATALEAVCEACGEPFTLRD